MFNLTTKAYIAVTESIRNFKKDEKGVTAIEYGLIAVAMAAVIIFLFFGNGGFISALKQKFVQLGETITNASATQQ